VDATTETPCGVSSVSVAVARLSNCFDSTAGPYTRPTQITSLCGDHFDDPYELPHKQAALMWGAR